MKKKAKFDYATLLKPTNFIEMKWKNGAGQTAEIATHPPGSSLKENNFLWRLSLAEVQAPGPFSSFPGYDRLLTLVNGAALELHFSESKKSLVVKPGDIAPFSGDEAVVSALPQGPVRDLNVLYKRGAAKAEITILRFTNRPRSFRLQTKTVFFYVVSGQFSTSTYPGELTFNLAAGDALRVDDLPKGQESGERLVLLEPKAADCHVVGVELSS